MPGADAQLGRHRDVPRLSFVLPAVAASVPTARHRLRAWLDLLDWPTDLAEDLEFATNEAVANVVDHAYLHTRSAETEWNVDDDEVIEEIMRSWPTNTSCSAGPVRSASRSAIAGTGERHRPIPATAAAG